MICAGLWTIVSPASCTMLVSVSVLQGVAGGAGKGKAGGAGTGAGTGKAGGGDPHPHGGAGGGGAGNPHPHGGGTGSSGGKLSAGKILASGAGSGFPFASTYSRSLWATSP